MYIHASISLHIADCLHSIAQKTLRLCLDIAERGMMVFTGS